MKSLFKKVYPSRAEKISAIKEEVNEGSYEIDSRNLANILIIHWLNHSIQFPGSLKRPKPEATCPRWPEGDMPWRPIQGL